MPVNLGVAYLSFFFADKHLLGVAQVTALAGALLLMFCAPRGSSLVQFVVSTFLIYSATIVMEGVAMSILSKVIPPAMRRGLCNAGLLATQFGSAGRLMANVAIAVVGLFAPSGLTDPAAAHAFTVRFVGCLAAATAAVLFYLAALYARLAGGRGVRRR